MNRHTHIPAKNVFSFFSMMSAKFKAVNMGQGYPDYSPPEFVKQCGVNAFAHADAMTHQYAPSVGHPVLTKSLARYFNLYMDQYKQFKDQYQQNHTVKPVIDSGNFLICNGATQALSVAIQTVVGPGDEVIVIEPFFNHYIYDIEIAGGKIVSCPLIPSSSSANDWVLPEGSLESAITDRTKLIILNNPQNVPGKVWSNSELQHIATLLEKYDLKILVDEIYMNFVYPEDSTRPLTPGGPAHCSASGNFHLFASIPGIFNRTITVGSVSKSFCITGWRVGWIMASSDIIQQCLPCSINQVFSVNTISQCAVASIFDMALTNGYFAHLQDQYLAKRNELYRILTEVGGANVVMPQGSFFMLLDISSIDPRHYTSDEIIKFAAEHGVAERSRDWLCSLWLLKEVGVAVIPCSAFTASDFSMDIKQTHAVSYDSYVRFAFCKQEESFKQLEMRISKLKNYLK